MILVILKSFFIGLISSVTLGPMGFLVIQRALSKGYKSGFASALGFILVDVLYGIIAIFSVSFLVDFIKDYNNEFQFIGGIIVIIVGIGINKSDPAREFRKKVRKKRDLVKDFVSVFFLTLPNPSPYITFSAYFATFNLVTTESNFMDKLWMITFLFIGLSTAWVIFLTILIKNKDRIGLRQLITINKIVSYVVIVCGIGILVHFVYSSLF